MGDEGQSVGPITSVSEERLRPAGEAPRVLARVQQGPAAPPAEDPRGRPRWGARCRAAPLPTPLSERVGRGLTRLGLRWYFGAVHIGREHIPSDGAAILVPNHPTLGDPFTVAFGTPRWVTWLAFDEALDWRVAGSVMRLYRAIPIDLHRPSPASIKMGYGTLAAGRLLGIFFEGERSWTYGLNRPLKTGAARMALRAGVPIVPVTISGARRLWPRERSLPRPGNVVVRYHPAIDVRAFRPDLHRKERALLLTEHLGRVIGGALPPAGTARFWRPT